MNIQSNEWAGQASQDVRNAIEKRLSSNQMALAELAYQEYDFGAKVVVTDIAQWKYTTDMERTRNLWVATAPEGEGQAPSMTLTFTVRFDSVTGRMTEAFAFDENGQIWGGMPDITLQQGNSAVLAAVAEIPALAGLLPTPA